MEIRSGPLCLVAHHLCALGGQGCVLPLALGWHSGGEVTCTCCFPSSDTRAWLFLGSLPWPAFFPAHSCKWGSSAVSHPKGYIHQARGVKGTGVSALSLRRVFWDFTCSGSSPGSRSHVLLQLERCSGLSGCGEELRVWAVSSEKVHCNSVFIPCKLSHPFIWPGVISGGMRTAGTSWAKSSANAGIKSRQIQAKF